MADMNSGIVQTQNVYAQDNAPSDNREGVIWVDTSKNPSQTLVYSTDTESWEAVATISATNPVIENRSSGVTYENNTGNVLKVTAQVYALSAGDDVLGRGYVDGLQVANPGIQGINDRADIFLYLTVPAGSTYKVTADRDAQIGKYIEQEISI